MPELPEVETIAIDLKSAHIIGARIKAVDIFWPKIVTTKTFAQKVIGQQISGFGRRAKYLLINLSSGNTLVIHLRMTGRVHIKPKHTPPLPHEHLIIHLDNDLSIHYHDTRKFGRWSLESDTSKVFSKLGPEPLDDEFTPKVFWERLKRTKRQLKPLLLDQHFLAGLGNIYVDEALWEAHLHPQTLSSSLTEKQANVLHGAIKKVLKKGLDTRGTTLGTGRTNYYRPDGTRGKHQESLNVFRRTGLPCPRCDTTIVRLIVGQRSTHICPHCQRKGTKAEVSGQKAE